MECENTTRPALPKIAWHLFRQALTPAEYAPRIGVSREHVRRLCLPFGDVRRRNPGPALRARIALESGGFIGPNDWAKAWEPEEMSE